MSESLLLYMQSKSPKSFVNYATYLTEECNVNEPWLHTELGIILVRSICNLIEKAGTSDLSENKTIRSL